MTRGSERWCPPPRAGPGASARSSAPEPAFGVRGVQPSLPLRHARCPASAETWSIRSDFGARQRASSGRDSGTPPQPGLGRAGASAAAGSEPPAPAPAPRPNGGAFESQPTHLSRRTPAPRTGRQPLVQDASPSCRTPASRGTPYRVTERVGPPHPDPLPLSGGEGTPALPAAPLSRRTTPRLHPSEPPVCAGRGGGRSRGFRAGGAGRARPPSPGWQAPTEVTTLRSP